MTLHVFNPEHDIALAYDNKYFTAPHAGRQLRHDLDYLPAPCSGRKRGFCQESCTAFHALQRSDPFCR